MMRKKKAKRDDHPCAIASVEVENEKGKSHQMKLEW